MPWPGPCLDSGNRAKGNFLLGSRGTLVLLDVIETLFGVYASMWSLAAPHERSSLLKLGGGYKKVMVLSWKPFFLQHAQIVFQEMLIIVCCMLPGVRHKKNDGRCQRTILGGGTYLTGLGKDSNT